MAYPIEAELDKAHRLLSQAATGIVFQIIGKRYRPNDTREALAKATKSIEVLRNLIDGAVRKV